MEKIFDVLILGGGPAGITAGIYAKRAGLDCAIVEKGLPGGAVNITHEVGNYTGFECISGMELGEKMMAHAQNLGVEMIMDEVQKAHIEGEVKVVECLESTYKAKVVILAFGAAVRKLNLENEKDFIGRGVSYCATCDGNLFKKQDVCVVGGGNTALEDALYLSNIANKVYLVVRRDEFKGEKYLSDRVQKLENVQILFNSSVVKIEGGSKLEKATVLNNKSGQSQQIDVSALFVCIGRGPDTEMIDGPLKLDDAGYIETNEQMKTNVEGVFAVGDIRNTPLRQIITACADGAVAASKAFEYLKTRG